MDILFFSLSFWIFFQTAESDDITVLGQINCKQNVETTNCPLNSTCSGTCQYPCHDIQRQDPDLTRQIWGTKVYAYHSSICKAATHDLRISTWDRNRRSFILQRISYHEDFLASIRSGIHSYSLSPDKLPSPEKGSFIFLSPKVNEEILDVASVHQAFIFNETEFHIQRCLISNKNIRSIRFRDFIPWRKISYDPDPVNLSGNVNIYQRTWPKLGQNETGGFQCVPEETVLSVVTSLAMSANADFYPSHMTYVANVNENVTLVMKTHSEGSISCASTWKKDNEELPEVIKMANQSPQEKTSLFLPEVQDGNQGLYTLECDSDVIKRGILRLIVRACPADKYGDNCTDECPECKNGGVCHDITGVCICPPGFNGTTCENACPFGYFGQTCSMYCPSGMTSQSKMPSCKGQLICLPDPYGCACASGYKGISCSESYPVLTAEIKLKESTSNSITIFFWEWNSNRDIGDGTPSTYRVYYRKNVDEEPWVSKDVSAVSPSMGIQYEVTVRDLELDTEYAVRVVILDVSGNSQEEGVKEYLFSTACSPPKEPPLNVNMSVEERRVSIHWELPPKNVWNCRTVKSVVKYVSWNISVEKWTDETNYNFISKPFTKWNVTVCIGPGTKEVNCARTINITTKEDAPGIVRDFSVTDTSSRSIHLIWNNPLDKNGIIRYFILGSQQMRWQHSCEEPFDPTYKILNISTLSATVRNLNPSAIYKFQLYAATVKAGPIQNLTTATEIDVPTGIPQQLGFQKSKNILSWKAPYCSVSNGYIKNYQITVEGLTPRDRYLRRSTTQNQFFKLALLSDTLYNAKVSASTEAGFGNNYAELVFTSENDLPTAPASITVKYRTENSIGITWKKPMTIKGTMLNYVVSFEELESNSDSSSLKNDGCASEYERSGSYIAFKPEFNFTCLTPATSYIVSIETNTTEGLQLALSEIVITGFRVPTVSRGPEFVDKTENTITVKIFPVKPQDPTIRYLVVVKSEETESDKETQSEETKSGLFSFPPSNCQKKFHGKEYITARLDLIPPDGRDFIVGDGSCMDGYSNEPLSSGTYQVGIAVVSEYRGEKKYSPVIYITEKIDVGISPKTGTYTIVLGILITLIVIAGVLIAIFAMPPRILLKAKQKANKSIAMLPWRRRRNPSEDFSFENVITDDDNPDDCFDTESTEEDISHVILLQDLERYISENLSNGELKNQFKALPKRKVNTCNAAKLPHNRMKNRYGNLLPYDHSIVKLKSTPEDPYSGYINANYVCGYKNGKKYIATQGPLPKTITDFWRMVWKEKCCKILMITNIVEQGRIKCEKYWPDETVIYGSITVTLKNSEQLADYIIRTFDISAQKLKREVKHYHYLTWPDHGAPLYTAPIIRFLKTAREYQPCSTGPIIVHCSAGVGRTGTVILLDSMLEMGMAEGQVDVCGHLCEMRRKRSNLLENLEQYIFVYKALEQALCWGETSVLCSDLVPQIGNLRKPDSVTCFTPLEMQYQRLGKICPRLDNVSMRVARLPENISKNRTMEILPSERARPILKKKGDEISPYINAVYVNGYKEKDAFLVTQYPLPNTISDFWQMIYETKSKTIVLLQNIDFTDPTCPQYWPSEGQTVSHGEYQIQCISVKTFSDMSIWKLNLSLMNKKDKSDESPIPVLLLHHLNWPVGQLLPQYPKSILDLKDKVEKTQREGKHVVTVQCLNGSTACGVFCASMFVCSKMISEQEVDIFLAVQNVRTNRPQFIENFEQYDFLCDIALSFLDSFEAYANFL